MRRIASSCLHALMLVLLLATVAEAQRDTAVPIQFDFISPGARSLALAGAFTGVANDATAAATNPAGLSSFRGGKFLSKAGVGAMSRHSSGPAV